MNDFLNSVKADLLDRRLLPVVAFVVVALVAALAYAGLSGGSSASSPSGPSAASPSGPAGLAATPKSAVTNVVAETTSGTSAQRHGAVHDPFAALPGSAKAATVAVSAAKSTSTSSTTSTSTAGSKTGSSPPASGEKAPTSTPKATTPTKPKAPATLYKVTIQFGPLPATPPPVAPVLPSYAGLSKTTPLPSAKEKLIEFLGVTVTRSGPSATFSLAGEVILHGAGSCLPSATQCRLIDLQAGKTEQLEYFTAAGQLVSYELRVVSIASSKASSASVKSVLKAQAKAARVLLGGGGSLTLAGMRFSSRAGVLVFATRRAHGPRARAR
jgi:hypothetical protein